MKLGAIAFAFALAATAFAEPEPEPKPQAQASSNSLNSISVLEVLATALPQSLLNLAITNSKAASSLISSQFAAGETPHWYSELPHDIQTYLVPVTSATRGPASTSASNSHTGTRTVTVSIMPTIMPAPNGTNHTTTRSHSTSKGQQPSGTGIGGGGNGGNGGNNGGGGGGGGNGGESLHAGVFGAGLAGVVALVGILAL